MKLGPVVQEEMSFKEKVNRRTKTDHNSSPSAFSSGELKNSGVQEKESIIRVRVG